VLAFFGVPISHEDDPERAVLPRLIIVHVIQSYGERIKKQSGFDINVRVGINKGLVVLGEVGFDLRVEYNELGDAINLAAPIEQSTDLETVLIACMVQKFYPKAETVAEGCLK
jgi:class 3 adenylate cyclase